MNLYLLYVYWVECKSGVWNVSDFRLFYVCHCTQVIPFGVKE